METEKKSLLTRYAVCFFIASLCVFTVFAIKGFFTSDLKHNMHVLSDAFFATGALFMLFYGLLFVSGEGMFLGVGYVLRTAFRALIPFSRIKHETYSQYRERKTGDKKGNKDSCIFFTGLFFFLISLIFLFILLLVGASNSFAADADDFDVTADSSNNNQELINTDLSEENSILSQDSDEIEVETWSDIQRYSNLTDKNYIFIINKSGVERSTPPIACAYVCRFD